MQQRLGQKWDKDAGMYTQVSSCDKGQEKHFRAPPANQQDKVGAIMGGLKPSITGYRDSLSGLLVNTIMTSSKV